MRSLSLLGTTLAYGEGNRLEVTVAGAPPGPTVPGSPHGEASPLQHRGGSGSRLQAIPVAGLWTLAPMSH